VRAVVLDASVAVKWATRVREPLSDESARLLKRYIATEIDFVVPDIFWAEIGNVLRKGARQGRWSQDDAESIAADMIARDFATVPSRELLPEALKIAFTYDRSVYDCLYVSLAVQLRTELITADGRLASALAGRFSIKWLGAL
jgi:predicted nucleic acid-binding protein